LSALASYRPGKSLKFPPALAPQYCDRDEVRNPTATEGKLEYVPVIRASKSCQCSDIENPTATEGKPESSRANAATSIALFRQILLAIVSEVSPGDVAVIIHTLKWTEHRYGPLHKPITEVQVEKALSLEEIYRLWNQFHCDDTCCAKIGF